MTPSAPVLHTVSTTASAALLALSLGFLTTSPALAATPEPSPTGTQAASDCGLVCVPILANNPDPGRPRKSKEPAQPPAQPAPPAEPSAQPVQPQPQGADTPRAGTPPQAGTPETAAPPVTAAEIPEESVTGNPSAAAGYRPPTGPSSGMDWNSPVTRTAGPAQVAAAGPARSPGPDGPALLPIALGTLLVGVSAGALAWWNRNRNRLRSH
ncbi:hypothetical protein [Pseudarthrobacter sp. BRE9]|uniref:hypothetical protein n=1 Tax=Pseudarthrobacter sp. BRE9 TaxID=2962582 RepID=UPI002880E5AF|nr:hypothetical protein [Pseudarthrobacter sp. BRE9]MDT0169949.1 hypothetical protein [Pseudarthrobacter sp. BRE9]